MPQSTERFSNRVENYIRYRPHYPQAIIECLQNECDFADKAVVADIGSGTGILTELFLRNGNVVYGVEPNREMREAGERLLRGYERFHSIAGTAEATTLSEASVDFVTAGQAFHWFDLTKSKAEFKRILKPHGWVVLVWNERLETETPFAKSYEQLLQTYGTDYEQVDHKHVVRDEQLTQFFGPNFQISSFKNDQHFDFEGLKGRLLSSSYAPEAGHPQHAPMLAELRRIFDAHQNDGQVPFEHETKIYYGHLN